MSLKTWAEANAKRLGFKALFTGGVPADFPCCAFIIHRDGMRLGEMPHCTVFLLRATSDGWKCHTYEKRTRKSSVVPDFGEDPEPAEGDCVECVFSVFPCSIHASLDGVSLIGDKSLDRPVTK